MKINEKKLADVCVNHGWYADIASRNADINNGSATVRMIQGGGFLNIERASGPFGAVNDMLRAIETCIEES
jgi:hypothetical protein